MMENTTLNVGLILKHLFLDTFLTPTQKIYTVWNKPTNLAADKTYSYEWIVVSNDKVSSPSSSYEKG